MSKIEIKPIKCEFCNEEFEPGLFNVIDHMDTCTGLNKRIDQFIEKDRKIVFQCGPAMEEKIRKKMLELNNKYDKKKY